MPELLSRRGLLGCFIAAPAIVRAGSLMRVRGLGSEVIEVGRKPILLTIDEITREAIRLFARSSQFMRQLKQEQELDFRFINGTQWDKIQ